MPALPAAKREKSEKQKQLKCENIPDQINDQMLCFTIKTNKQTNKYIVLSPNSISVIHCE